MLKEYNLRYFVVPAELIDKHLDDAQKIPTNLSQLLATFLFGTTRQQVHANDAALYEKLFNEVNADNPSLVYTITSGKIPIGKLVGKDDLLVSYPVLVWLLMLYRTEDPYRITVNLQNAIARAIKLLNAPYDPKDRTWVRRAKQQLSNLPHAVLAEDKNALQTLQGLLSQQEVQPSHFKKWLDDMMQHHQNIVSGQSRAYVDQVMNSGMILSPEQFSTVLDAMFRLFLAGYKPIASAGIMPDMVITMLEDKQAFPYCDFLYHMDEGEVPKAEAIVDHALKVIFSANEHYGTAEDPIYTNEDLWASLHKKYPGLRNVYYIIQHKLSKGYYDTSSYAFSNYKLYMSDTEEGTQKSAFTTLFASFILGHILNAIDAYLPTHLYTYIVPAISALTGASEQKQGLSTYIFVPLIDKKRKNGYITFELSGSELRVKLSPDAKWIATSTSVEVLKAYGGAGSGYSLLYVSPEEEKKAYDIQITSGSLVASSSDISDMAITWQKGTDGNIESIALSLKQDSGENVIIGDIRASEGDVNAGKNLNVEVKSQP